MSRVRSTHAALILVVLALAMVLGTVPAGSGPPRTDGPNPLSVTDVIHIQSASGFNFSPDGEWVLWVKNGPDMKKNQSKSNIYLTSLSDTVTVQLTFGSRSDGSPKFSPGGGKVAFLRRPDKGQNQIYLMNLRGGEPTKLTSVATGVRRFDWLSENEMLFTARADSTWRETRLKKDKDDVIIVADQEHYPPVRLYRLDIEAEETEIVSTNDGVIREFAVSPDRRYVATNENQSVDYAYDNRIPPKQFLYDLEKDSRQELFTAPHLDPQDFKWAHDGRGFYCRRAAATDTTDTYVGISELYYFDLNDQQLVKVPLDWPNGLGGSYEVVAEGIVVSLADGVRSRLAFARKTKNGWDKSLMSSPTGQPMRLLAGDNLRPRLIYLTSSASTVPVVQTAEIENRSLWGERTLLELNESIQKKSLSRTEVISWPGALGDTVEGILYYPLQFEPDSIYPLMAWIHGGPSGVDRDFFTERWSNYPHLLASKGMFVLKVNYHGSGNYGLEWVESIKGRYYEYEVPDIISGIDHVIGLGLADSSRLGIMGWSNGSILAIECCLRDSRFKVLSAGAGDVNWTSDYGNCAFGAGFDNAYFGGPPWERPEHYLEKSPLFRMEKLTTPTLIMFGTRDTNVPTEQGWQHFRAMQQIGKAPVRFLLFPGASHGLSKLSHKKRKMEEELAWIDTYLLSRKPDTNEALNETSPLAFELKKADISRQGHLAGKQAGGFLVPEVVEFENIRIGRFEVTRAQFQAFDPNFTVDPGTQNYPVTEISLPLAQTYCMWLSEKTGRKFRLPTVDEMTTLVKAAKKNLSHENTLDYWVGYQITADDARLLQPKIEALEKSRLLIEPVGSFRPVGEAGLYDLGGNVAEWVVDKEGKGRIMGLSAVSLRDERLPYKRPPLRYVGFRVREELEE